MPRILQFTDLHLRDDPAAEVRGVAPQRGFDSVLYHVRQHHWPADAVLLTGDLAHDEFEFSYRRLAATAAGWKIPVLALAGNHDDHSALRDAFGEIPQAAGSVLDLGKWRLIGLDSQVPGKVHGELNETQWQLLERAALTAEGRHLLVAIHHPPLELGSAWLDRIGLRGADEFRQWLANFGVKACLFGHAHQEWGSVDQGVRYLGTPSTARQFLPGSDVFAESDAPPAYRWLQLHDDGSIESDVVWVGDA